MLALLDTAHDCIRGEGLTWRSTAQVGLVQEALGTAEDVVGMGVHISAPLLRMTCQAARRANSRVFIPSCRKSAGNFNPFPAERGRLRGEIQAKSTVIEKSKSKSATLQEPRQHAGMAM